MARHFEWDPLVDKAEQTIRTLERLQHIESEFGTTLGVMHGGSVVHANKETAKKHGPVVYVSCAFNPLTATQLRQIADQIDNETEAKKKGNHGPA